MRDKLAIIVYLEGAISNIRMASKIIGSVTEESPQCIIDIAEDISNAENDLWSAKSALERLK